MRKKVYLFNFQIRPISQSASLPYYVVKAPWRSWMQSISSPRP